MEDKDKFNSLCSHYKDTVENHKETLKQRDMLFYGLLIIIAVFTSSVDTMASIADQYVNQTFGVNLGVNANFISTTLWLIILRFTIKYFQKVVEIEWQYEYLQSLENELNRYFDDDSVKFTRKGKFYSKYRYFSKWIECLYTIFFPLILLGSTSTRIYKKINEIQKININIIINSSSYIIIVISIVLYVTKMHSEKIKNFINRIKKIK